MNTQDLSSSIDLIKQELAPLAEKLGQGAEWTFEIYVRQVYVEAVIAGFIGVVLFTMAFIGYKSMRYPLNISEEENFQPSDETKDRLVSVFVFGLVLAFISGVGIIIWMTVGAPQIIQALINPEYRAIELLVNDLRGN